MLTTVDQRGWSDIVLGVLEISVPAGFSEATLTIKFDENIRPFPEPPFLFVIGGQIRTSTNPVVVKSIDNREVVMCIEKVNDTTYKVSRDVLGVGVYPPKHDINEVVFQNTMAGTLWGNVKQLDYFSHIEGQIGYLEELLLILFGADTTIIEGLWPEFDHFAVTPSIPPSQEVKILPGGYFVKDPKKPGLVKILVIAPNMKVYGRSNLIITYPPVNRKCRALVYIDNEGGISVFYGEVTTNEKDEPSSIDISSITNVNKPLAELYLDGVVEDKVITSERIKDLRK